MKKRHIVLILLLLFGLSSFSYALSNYQGFSGQIDSIQVWANGTDTNGIWVSFEQNPEGCAGGFYMKHNQSNDKYVFGMLQTAKTLGKTISIQIGKVSEIIEDRCPLSGVWIYSANL
jgi:hypothetical protein